VGGLFLPLEFFPRALREVVRWLPFQFVTYAPARAFVKFDLAFVAQALAGQVAYIALFAGIVSAVWWRARRRLVVHGG
jgi:ABC-2 type transport system permease protein